ncbi:snakin-2-like [Mangifera indica]|uniref:snakin-2-like n=1 Tax=Mangifera indica TaxID=29780 RepID=UPI001CFBDC23|nr:snakin-2-like [Mangifera indica]
MASSKAFVVASLVISLLLLLHHIVEADEALASPAQAPQMDCGGACSARCRLSSRPRLCKRACGSCCARCNCVPPGTSGNYEVCPCYANLTTRAGQHKCP